MPEHEAIHAGLECGIIGALNRDLELISFGAEVIDPHSPDEAVDIASVGKSWELLCGILENIPEK
jgi:dipeptidase D